MEKIETIKTPEQKEYTSKIELHFFRHSIKETEEVNLPNDLEVKLSAEGKGLAKERAFDYDGNPDQSLAFGSPRVRAQETAGLVMAGKELELTGIETLDELKEKLDKGLELGSKIGIEENLDFPEDKSNEYHKITQQHFVTGDLLKFLVEESDQLAKKFNDTKTFTYSRSARQIAEIIQKYEKIAPRWNQLVEDKSKNYTDTLERFMSTHQTISESFLAKAIEKTKGIEERNKFISSAQNVGFGYVEGFDAEILNTKDGQKIHISYRNEKDNGKSFIFDEYIKPELLDEIIEEGK